MGNDVHVCVCGHARICVWVCSCMLLLRRGFGAGWRGGNMGKGRTGGGRSAHNFTRFCLVAFSLLVINSSPKTMWYSQKFPDKSILS